MIDSTDGKASPEAAVSADEPGSPCLSICALDENDICLGCYRSAEEITDWFMASAMQKREMLERARARREADNPIRLL
ncbi:DUF1289 domain-containing protein [Congregibacter sp.]|uniref:DUF1289 domain-containing protein n=1 Tax=Congregibacter sp. TaxID=2744308 RepID=UPI00385F4FBF